MAADFVERDLIERRRRRRERKFGAAPSRVRPSVPGYVRVKEAAAILGLSTRTVWRLIKAGDLTPYHLQNERAVRIERAELAKLTHDTPQRL